MPFLPSFIPPIKFIILHLCMYDLSAPESNLPVVLGVAIPVGLVAGVTIFIIAFLVICLVSRQYKLHRSVKVYIIISMQASKPGMQG